MKYQRVLFFSMGVLISVYGLKLFFNSGYHSWRFGYLNFGEYHQVLGSTFFLIGLFAVLSVLRKHK